MYTEAHKKATMKYREKSIKTIQLDFNLVNDKDIIDKLNSVKNKTGYIRELIRKDISGE